MAEWKGGALAFVEKQKNLVPGAHPLWKQSSRPVPLFIKQDEALQSLILPLKKKKKK